MRKSDLGFMGPSKVGFFNMGFQQKKSVQSKTVCKPGTQTLLGMSVLL